MEAFAAKIGPRSSYSPLQPFSSNQITRRTFSVSTGLSSFYKSGRNSCPVHGLVSFHSKTHDSPFYPLPPTKKTPRISPAMATGSVQEVLPQALDSTSDPPRVFDGTTRLYISYSCPYAQRAWITRNCKGLQDKIKLVPIDLKNRPVWYKVKVYPANKDPSNKEFTEELFSYVGTFYKTITSSFKGEESEAAPGIAFDSVETALSKFEDGPFFLGQFSLVDIAYAPFIERFQPFLLDVTKYDITLGRPKLATWIEEVNKNEGYKQTKNDPKELVEGYKKRFLAQL